MTRNLFVCLLVFTSAVECVLGYNRGDYIPDRKCATLFSAPDFQGDAFVLKDFDQSVNLERDYRTSLAGWMKTRSTRVERGCQMTVCNDTNFLGSCHLLTSNIYFMSGVFSAVRSSNCTCRRECSCESVYIGKEEYGRAYLKGGCNTCNSEYISLAKEHVDIFPSAERNAVTAFAIRTGCNLTIYYGVSKSLPTTITIQQRFRGTVGSYQFSCDNTKFSSHAPDNMPVYSGDMIDLQDSKIGDPVGLLAANDSRLNHPGIRAALFSNENGRSAKNAYIIVIGTQYAKDFGFPQCNYGSSEQIMICRIPVNMEHLGISNSKLNIITVPIAHKTSVEVDYRLMATMDQYLSTHEDLKEVIPNAVIVGHSINDKNIAGKRSIFQRKLHALHLLRGFLLDENYSNVVFLLEGLQSLPASEKIQPETKIKEFMNAINTEWKFPSPIAILPLSHDGSLRFGKCVNGYSRMENREYWPRNLEVSLGNLCEKTGDPLGHAILKAYFQIKHIPIKSVNPTIIDALPANHSKVIAYQETASNNNTQPTFRGIFPLLSSRLDTNSEVQTQNNNFQQLGSKLSKEEIATLPENSEKMNNTLIEMQRQIINLESKLEQEMRARKELSEKFDDISVEIVEKAKEQVWEKLKEDLNKLFH